jgi:hypothetical protein
MLGIMVLLVPVHALNASPSAIPTRKEFIQKLITEKQEELDVLKGITYPETKSFLNLALRMLVNKGIVAPLTFAAVFFCTDRQGAEEWSRKFTETQFQRVVEHNNAVTLPREIGDLITFYKEPDGDFSPETAEALDRTLEELAMRRANIAVKTGQIMGVIGGTILLISTYTLLRDVYTKMSAGRNRFSTNLRITQLTQEIKQLYKELESIPN